MEITPKKPPDSKNYSDSKPPPQPVILPAAFTSSQPPESFNDPERGHLSWHTLFSRPWTSTSDLSAGIATCPPLTGSLRPHRHAQAEIYYILDCGSSESTDDNSHSIAGSDGPSSRPSSSSSVSAAGSGGGAIVVIDGVHHPVEKGSAIFIPGEAEHSVINESPTHTLRWLYVFATEKFTNVHYRFSHE